MRRIFRSCWICCLEKIFHYRLSKVGNGEINRCHYNQITKRHTDATSIIDLDDLVTFQDLDASDDKLPYRQQGELTKWTSPTRVQLTHYLNLQPPIKWIEINYQQLVEFERIPGNGQFLYKRECWVHGNEKVEPQTTKVAWCFWGSQHFGQLVRITTLTVPPNSSILTGNNDFVVQNLLNKFVDITRPSALASNLRKSKQTKLKFYLTTNIWTIQKFKQLSSSILIITHYILCWQSRRSGSLKLCLPLPLLFYLFGKYTQTFEKNGQVFSFIKRPNYRLAISFMWTTYSFF